MAGGGVSDGWGVGEAGRTGFAVVEGQVAHRVLLVAHAGARGTAVEGEVGHDAAAAFFNEQTNVHDVGCGGHVEYDVLEAGGLRGRPMHARGRLRWWNGPRVNHKVANLPEEEVDSLPVEVGGVVRISVDEPKAFKVCGCPECGRSRGITDELGKVGRLDGSRDQVGAGGEVNKSRCGGCRRLLVSVVSVVPPFLAHGLRLTHPWLQGFPALMALLIAAVSSVTPSPILRVRLGSGIVICGLIRLKISVHVNAPLAP